MRFQSVKKSHNCAQQREDGVFVWSVTAQAALAFPMND